MTDTTDAALKIARELNRLEEDNRRLAAQLAAAEARAARLAEWGLDLEEFGRSMMLNHPNPNTDFSIGEMRLWYLHDGDLEA